MRRPAPLFLERASYRRRRLGDAARVLPALALTGVLLPVWLMPQTTGGAGGMVALFSGWAALIAATAALHRALSRADDEARHTDQAVDSGLGIVTAPSLPEPGSSPPGPAMAPSPHPTLPSDTTPPGTGSPP